MQPPATIRTERLQLVAATKDIVTSELEDRARFAEVLGAIVPENWPPELYDRQATQYMLDRLLESPAYERWGGRYLVLPEVDARRTLIGTAGYKGPPDAEGRVEIGYGLLKAFRKRGLATEAAKGLIDTAFEHSAVRAVRAQTLANLTASIGVLERNHFALVGEGKEDDLITMVYELTRERYGRSMPSPSLREGRTR